MQRKRSDGPAVVSCRCRHPSQFTSTASIAGWYIQHTAISGVASNFQHVKICWRPDNGPMITTTTPPPSLVSLSHRQTQIPTEGNYCVLSNVSPKRRRRFELLDERAAACQPPLPSSVAQSITHLLMSILSSPMGRKRPSLGQKGNTQDGSAGWVGVGRGAEMSKPSIRHVLGNLCRETLALFSHDPHPTSNYWMSKAAFCFFFYLIRF